MFGNKGITHWKYSLFLYGMMENKKIGETESHRLLLSTQSFFFGQKWTLECSLTLEN
jgi:hypothetical protein